VSSGEAIALTLPRGHGARAARRRPLRPADQQQPRKLGNGGRSLADPLLNEPQKGMPDERQASPQRRTTHRDQKAEHERERQQEHEPQSKQEQEPEPVEALAARSGA
jgi:hypothetical protein